MAKKAYWVTSYRSISNPEALAAYAKLAGPAIAGQIYLSRHVCPNCPRSIADEICGAGERVLSV